MFVSNIRNKGFACIVLDWMNERSGSSEKH